jgi:hypothetical protein
MKNISYILLFAIFAISCKKTTDAPISPAAALNKVGLQFGKTYAYTHYYKTQSLEQGFITFNSDTSFTEIVNTDTFFYHSTLFYTFNGSYSIQLPQVDTVSGNAAGLHYVYNYHQSLQYYLFFGRILLAWSGLNLDAVLGSGNKYPPIAYFLKYYPTLALTEYGNVPQLSPPGTTDSAGNVTYCPDKIVFN